MHESLGILAQQGQSRRRGRHLGVGHIFDPTYDFRSSGTKRLFRLQSVVGLGLEIYPNDAKDAELSSRKNRACARKRIQGGGGFEPGPTSGRLLESPKPGNFGPWSSKRIRQVKPQSILSWDWERHRIVIMGHHEPLCRLCGKSWWKASIGKTGKPEQKVIPWCLRTQVKLPGPLFPLEVLVHLSRSPDDTSPRAQRVDPLRLHKTLLRMAAGILWLV